jgi:alginate O-acetyltransferase complex protein AlgI
LVALAAILNIGLLAYFKYTNFFIKNLNIFLLKTIGHFPFELDKIHLPLGISFFTFHALSYVIDISRNKANAQKDIGKLILYFTFFPQLVAGPIIRYHDVETQLTNRTITIDDFAEGVRRFILGLGKKALIANALAEPADQIFAIPGSQLTPGLSWLGIICYTLQIYFDFSGYSDMAIGLGRMFGFHFLENFNYPYISQSIQEFWRRWHISLSNWFKDYLYIPLGGNRCSPLRTYINLTIVFFLCGLWHGASWNFIFWGLFHGMFIVFERIGLLKVFTKAKWLAIRHFYAIIIIMMSWVFFRATTLSYALSFLKAMTGFAQGTGLEYHASLYLNLEIMLALLVGIVASTPVLSKLSRFYKQQAFNCPKRMAAMIDGIFLSLSNLALAVIFLMAVIKLAAGTYNPFIYFQF